MTIRERIEQDFIREFKAKNEAAVSTLRMLRAAMKNAEIEKMKPLEESDIMDVLGKEVKKLKDSLEPFSIGGRADLVEKAKAEITLLEAYLPAQLDDGALRAIVKERAASIGAAGPKDFGRVMSEVMKEAKGRADGSKVSALVKEVLAGS